MIRWLSIGVITYMILGIIWWGLLLYSKNQTIFDLQLKIRSNEVSIEELESERQRQSFMILGEGFVLGCSLLMGLYIITRSANKELQSAKQQNDFLLSVSHELKSPIAAIKLALQTLKRKGLPAEKQQSILSSALKDSNRLEKLVQNILLSANIESKPIELLRSKVNISQLIKKLIKTHESDFHKIELEDSLPEKKAILSIDQLGVAQAISNIIDNAIKYATPSSTIKIKLFTKDNNIKCVISNHGAPISEKDQLLIFEKFYRSSSSEIRTIEGTGLGLYLSKVIIDAHDGSIQANSKDGMNQFSILLPIIE